jgi:hypothetical protein
MVCGKRGKLPSSPSGNFASLLSSHFCIDSLAIAANLLTANLLKLIATAEKSHA